MLGLKLNLCACLSAAALLALQATFLYASLLRQLAHQGVQDMLGLSPGSTAMPAGSEAAAAALAAAATQLRQVSLSKLELKIAGMFM
jgi:hypothetical protein